MTRKTSRNDKTWKRKMIETTSEEEPDIPISQTLLPPNANSTRMLIRTIHSNMCNVRYAPYSGRYHLPQLMCASLIDVFVIQSNPTRAAGPHVGTDPVSVRFHDPTGCPSLSATNANSGYRLHNTYWIYQIAYAFGSANRRGDFRTDTGSVPTCRPAARVGLGLDFGVPFRYLVSNSRDFLVRQTKIKTADSFLWESTVGVRGGS